VISRPTRRSVEKARCTSARRRDHRLPISDDERERTTGGTRPGCSACGQRDWRLVPWSRAVPRLEIGCRLQPGDDSSALRSHLAADQMPTNPESIRPAARQINKVEPIQRHEAPALTGAVRSSGSRRAAWWRSARCRAALNDDVIDMIVGWPNFTLCQ
jgi:hypothetical protein